MTTKVTQKPVKCVACNAQKKECRACDGKGILYETITETYGNNWTPNTPLYPTPTPWWETQETFPPYIVTNTTNPGCGNRQFSEEDKTFLATLHGAEIDASRISAESRA